MSVKLPQTMIVSGRNYKLIDLLLGDKLVRGTEIFKSAMYLKKQLKGKLRIFKQDGLFLLTNQADIPCDLRGKVAFVFMDWRNPDDSGEYACVFYTGNRWEFDWSYIHKGRWNRPAIVLQIQP